MTRNVKYTHAIIKTPLVLRYFHCKVAIIYLLFIDCLFSRDADLRWTIIGIVSTGPAECGATPVIYHRVMSSVSWVLDTLANQESALRSRDQY